MNNVEGESSSQVRGWHRAAVKLTSGGLVGHALQLLHNVDVQQLKGQEVLRSHRDSMVILAMRKIK